jgi:hypothetical protein
MLNENNLPDWLVEVVESTRNQYDAGEKTDYSATSLLVPPMIYALQKKYEPEEDVADSLPAFFGTCVHDKIEEYLKKNPRYIVEERLYYTFHIPNAPGEQKDFVVSAQIDLYDTETKELSDHKFSKAMSFQQEKPEYEFQLSLQRYLMMKAGYEIKSIRINGLAKDWTATGPDRDKQYPKTAYMPVNFPLWDDTDVEAAVERKILEKEYAKLGQIRMCDESERWHIPGKYAVMKEGRKSAVLLFDNEGDAQVMALEKGKGHYVEHRKGRDIRCTNKSYCNVREHCPYYKENYGG